MIGRAKSDGWCTGARELPARLGRPVARKVRAKPGSVRAARGLTRAIVNIIDPEGKDPIWIEELLAKLRRLRLTFGADEELAHRSVA